MKELYSIMEDLLEIEYNQKSLLYMLETIEPVYEGQEQEETKLVVHHTKGSLAALQTEIRATIEKLDQYIAAKAGQQFVA